jgi:hypothetical protein
MLGFSRKELAEAVGGGMDVSMIGKWERRQFSPSPAWDFRPLAQSLEEFAARLREESESFCFAAWTMFSRG